MRAGLPASEPSDDRSDQVVRGGGDQGHLQWRLWRRPLLKVNQVFKSWLWNQHHPEFQEPWRGFCSGWGDELWSWMRSRRFPGGLHKVKKNLFSHRIKTTLFCSGSMSICRGFSKTWARHEANFWNQTFILKILVCLPQYIFMLSSGQNLNSLHNHYAYHSLVKRKYWQTLTGNHNISSFALTNIRRTLSTQECGPSGLAGGGWCAWHCKRLRSAKYAPTYWTWYCMLADIVWFCMAYYDN